MSTSPSTSAVYTPDSDDSGKVGREEAMQRISKMRQGNEGVSRFFEKCLYLVEIINERPVEKNDAQLFSAFMKGLLSEKTRKVIQLAGVSDAYTARKIAILEEIFDTMPTLSQGVEEDRIHKVELLQHLTWDKLRHFEGKMSYMQHDMHNIRKEVLEAKGILMQFLEQQKLQNAMLEQKLTETVAPSTLSSAPDTSSEEILSNIAQVEKAFSQKLAEMEGTVALSYEWIRQIHVDIQNVSVAPKEPVNPATNRPSTATHPNKRPNPMSPQEGSSAKTPSPVSKKLRKTEKMVIDSLKGVLSEQQIDQVTHGDVVANVNELYKEYRSVVADIKKWMMHTPRPVTSACILCGETANVHHSYECPMITNIDQRKKILRSRNFCEECSKEHNGKCTSVLYCKICSNAANDNRTIIDGFKHSRMMCPLQEEYHLAIDLCNKLLAASNSLQAV